MKILVNYKKLDIFQDEFFEVELKKFDAVFAEMPIAIAEYDCVYKRPVLYIGLDVKMPTIFEAEALLEKIKGTKLYYFKKLESDGVEEVSKEYAEFAYRLPVDTPVEKLVMIQGQIGLLERTEV